MWGQEGEREREKEKERWKERERESSTVKGEHYTRASVARLEIVKDASVRR